MNDRQPHEPTSPWRGDGALGKAELPSLRRQGSACVSDLQLDRLLLGELADTERYGVEAHLRACTACAGGRQALASERTRFEMQVDVVSAAARALAQPGPTRSVRWRRWLPTMLVAAGGAAVVLLAGPLIPAPDGYRTKGGVSLSTYVQRQGSTLPATLHLGEPLHPGDRLQFRYSGQDGHLIILSADTTGQVSVYYPPAAAAAPVSAGREVPLASAVELDDVLGTETVVALRCSTALPVADAQKALARVVKRAGQDAALGLPCDEFRLHLTKVATGAPGRPR